MVHSGTALLTIGAFPRRRRRMGIKLSFHPKVSTPLNTFMACGRGAIVSLSTHVLHRPKRMEAACVSRAVREDESRSSTTSCTSLADINRKACKSRVGPQQRRTRWLVANDRTVPARPCFTSTRSEYSKFKIIHTPLSRRCIYRQLRRCRIGSQREPRRERRMDLVMNANAAALPST